MKHSKGNRVEHSKMGELQKTEFMKLCRLGIEYGFYFKSHRKPTEDFKVRNDEMGLVYF